MRWFYVHPRPCTHVVCSSARLYVCVCVYLRVCTCACVCVCVCMHAETPEARMERKRTSVATEIVSTERTYVATLTMLINVFLKPMREAAAARPVSVTDARWEAGGSSTGASAGVMVTAAQTKVCRTLLYGPNLVEIAPHTACVKSYLSICSDV